MTDKIAIIGLGYVGLPVALAMGTRHEGVIGFDVKTTRVDALNLGYDSTNEVTADDIEKVRLLFTADPAALSESTFFIVTVPTPIDADNRPDLGPLKSACTVVGKALKPGDLVVFESTVYPGATEDFCGPALEAASGLKSGVDFFLGYSPERINPGDRLHRFNSIVKIVAAQTPEALDRIRAAYGPVVVAGLHEAPSIKVAEAAKVIENTQRDLNIALMNELAVICHRLDIRTKDVLDAAGTKWNFLKFTPGLVGGHCIGVDPYYLTAKAEQMGYHPEVILAGRRINDGMGAYIVDQILNRITLLKKETGDVRVGILGLTFKENVPDIRNSKIIDMITVFRKHGVPPPLVHDPLADKDEVAAAYGIQLSAMNLFRDLDVLIVAVPHRHYTAMGLDKVLPTLKPGGLLVDLKSIYNPEEMPAHYGYWSL